MRNGKVPMTDRAMRGREGGRIITITMMAASAFLVFSLMWEGFPFALIGIPAPLTRYLVSLCLIGSFFLYMISAPRVLDRLTAWEILPIILIIYFFFVSAISASIFYPQSPSEWVFASYAVFPLLLIFFVRSFKLRSGDLINAVLIASLIVSTVVWLDQLLNFNAMESYSRLATTDESQRRVVLFKTQVSLACVVCYSRLFHAQDLKGFATWTLLFLFQFGCLAIVMESRLTLAALLLSLACYTAFILDGTKRLYGLIIGGMVGAALGPLMLYKYIEQATRYQNYIQDDVSIAWRLQTTDYYHSIYEKTFGLGFGIMSGHWERDNPLAFGQNFAGYFSGSSTYNLYLADTGIFGALYQFGIVGIGLAILMSLVAACTMIRIGRKFPTAHGRELGIIGLLMLFYVVSPWPTNFFTLEWSVFAGATFWCIAACGAGEYRFRTRSLADRPVNAAVFLRRRGTGPAARRMLPG